MTTSDQVVYRGVVASPVLAGEATMDVGRDAITVTTLFDSTEIPYSQLRTIAFANHQVRIATTDGDFEFTRMGEWAQRFRGAARAANHAALLRAHSVLGSPVVTARGAFTNPQAGRRNLARFEVYPRCVMALLDDGGAVRVPIGYLTAVRRSSAGLALEIGTGESYSLERLGHAGEPVAQAIEAAVRAAHASALAMVRRVAPAVPHPELVKVARHLHDGVAADLSELFRLSPGFVARVEGLIAASRIADTFPALRELAGSTPVFVGIRPFPPSADEVDAPDDLVPWVIAPLAGASALPEVAAVELPVPPGEAGATYGYRTHGESTTFAARLNRALGSVDFRRGPFRLSDAQLAEPQHADDLVAARRITEVAAIRAAFAGRAIHAAAWDRQVRAFGC